LSILASSPETGAAIVAATDSPILFMTGHLEYLADTLSKEYERDVAKMGDAAPRPQNYDTENPHRTWEAANAMFYGNFVELCNEHAAYRRKLELQNAAPSF
jgi:homoserine O-succinyltransferase